MRALAILQAGALCAALSACTTPAEAQPSDSASAAEVVSEWGVQTDALRSKEGACPGMVWRPGPGYGGTPQEFQQAALALLGHPTAGPRGPEVPRTPVPELQVTLDLPADAPAQKLEVFANGAHLGAVTALPGREASARFRLLDARGEPAWTAAAEADGSVRVSACFTLSASSARPTVTYQLGYAAFDVRSAMLASVPGSTATSADLHALRTLVMAAKAIALLTEPPASPQLDSLGAALGESIEAMSWSDLQRLEDWPAPPGAAQRHGAAVLRAGHERLGVAAQAFVAPIRRAKALQHVVAGMPAVTLPNP